MKLRIGLLPCYLSLYDEVAPTLRQHVERFYGVLCVEFEKLGLEVVTADICRVEAEFSAALDRFLRSNVDAVVSVHLAYSPSLEALEPLLSCTVPLIVLDTTPDYDFGPAQEPERISFNHGIHGVQDLCSMLVRNGRDFAIEVGHWRESDVLARVRDRVRAIAAARSLEGMRIGLIGEPFRGMGDFYVDPDTLQQVLRVTTVQFPNRTLPESSDDELEHETQYVSTLGTIVNVPDEVLRENLRISRGLRLWMRSEGLSGFSCNFLHVIRGMAVNRMPFLYASIGMYEGFGYAGEGDVLTAALTSALLRLNPETSFTEMFCPDWNGGTVFLSHMGEINPRVCTPYAAFRTKEYHYSDAEQPIYTTGQFKAGAAHLVNVVPLVEERFRLIVAPVSVESHRNSSFGMNVHGWIRPELPLPDFLKEYSSLGGTHHNVLVYGESTEIFRAFGETLGWDVAVIGDRNS